MSESSLPLEFNKLKLPCLQPGDIVSAGPIGAGKNNKVYKVTLRNGSSRILKFYFNHPTDKRDRLTTEFKSMEFLWKNGARCVPEPLCMDKDTRCAVFNYIETSRREKQPISTNDLDQVIKFIGLLKNLSKLPEASALADASEASFSLKALFQNIKARIDILQNVDKSSNPAQAALDDFMAREFSPFFTTLSEWVKKQSNLYKIEFDKELPIEQRTLSPSDLGFHNAIKGLDECWIFQDFEYFGWDDPSKLIADFILHPAMVLSAELQAYFVVNTLSCFTQDAQLPQRLEIVYPLYGVKWCTILLNEFVPEFRARRGFANQLGAADLHAVQVQQLAKAHAMLDHVFKGYERFAKLLKI